MGAALARKPLLPTPLERATEALRAPPMASPEGSGTGAGALRAKPKFVAVPVGQVPGKLHWQAPPRGRLG
eukprot:1084709-Alexandrium_andersonii.AAC.1